MPVEVVSLGETMVLLEPTAAGPLEDVPAYRQRIGGAESNFAVGLARLGHRVAWISAVGDDPFGRLIRREIGKEGVDLSHLRTDPDWPTAVFFKERIGGVVKVYYYRKGSAVSHLGPDALDPAAFRGARVFHTTGISLALGETLAATTRRAMELAREAGCTVCFDPNLRPSLWSIEQARAGLLPVIAGVDVLLSGLQEMRALLETEEIGAIMAWCRERGVGQVVLKDGARGSHVLIDGEARLVPPVEVGEEVDPVGAGDAFDAGFVSGLLRGWDPHRCALLGNIAGAYATQTPGDYESVPTWEQAQAELERLGVRS
ncbi:MAG TPA: sugar kinase [Thermomicrobiales bacterium]|nr:sugar kinase [Thermomicrobiales bacterium]